MINKAHILIWVILIISCDRNSSSNDDEIKLGMDISEVERILGFEPELKQASLVYASEPTELQLNMDENYFFRVEELFKQKDVIDIKISVDYVFNSRKKLIKIERVESKACNSLFFK